MNDRKMPATFVAIDLDDDRIAGRAINVDLRFRTGRSTRPTLAQFDAWLLIGWWA